MGRCELINWQFLIQINMSITHNRSQEVEALITNNMNQCFQKEFLFNKSCGSHVQFQNEISEQWPKLTRVEERKTFSGIIIVNRCHEAVDSFLFDAEAEIGPKKDLLIIPFQRAIELTKQDRFMSSQIKFPGKYFNNTSQISEEVDYQPKTVEEISYSLFRRTLEGKENNFLNPINKEANDNHIIKFGGKLFNVHQKSPIQFIAEKYNIDPNCLMMTGR